MTEPTVMVLTVVAVQEASKLPDDTEAVAVIAGCPTAKLEFLMAKEAGPRVGEEFEITITKKVKSPLSIAHSMPR